MNASVQRLLIHIIRLLLRTLYIFPVRRNKVLFMSYVGRQYSCSPKYLFQHLAQLDGSHLDLVWVYEGPQPADEDFKVAKKIRPNSFRYIFEAMTCAVFVTNIAVTSYIPFRKKQVTINTWHGGGAYKKAGLDITNSKIAQAKVEMIRRQTTRFLSSSKTFSAVMHTAYRIENDQLLEFGLPRNDLLLSAERREYMRQIVRSFYGIPTATRLVLYAPTFREYSFDADNEVIAVSELLDCLRQKNDTDWAFSFRTHHHWLGETPVTKTQSIDVTAYPDMQELLCAADILITDYSSCMWDFSLTGKPCFIYAPDADQYRQERDFYMPMSQWPFPVALNNGELIRNIMAFDPADYARRVKQHHDDLGSCESGQATQIVGELILSACRGKGRDQA